MEADNGLMVMVTSTPTSSLTLPANEMIKCLGLIDVRHFPDKKSGLVGIIWIEVNIWFRPGLVCADDAIAAVGGPKIKCGRNWSLGWADGWWLMIRAIGREFG